MTGVQTCALPICVVKDIPCNNCPLNTNCAYSILFENPINKNIDILKGRDKAPSPYIIQLDFIKNIELTKIPLKIIFLDYAADYIGYFILALKNIGVKGITKDKINFQVNNITCNNMPYTNELEFSSIDFSKFDLNENKFRENNKNTLNSTSKIEIQFITPFRYKENGKYKSNIKLKDIIIASKRRLNILSTIYGNKKIIEDFEINEFIDIDLNFKWIDNKRYSKRQESNMIIGGVIGSGIYSGEISNKEINILTGGSIFNIGKNVSFGLGHFSFNIFS